MKKKKKAAESPHLDISKSMIIAVYTVLEVFIQFTLLLNAYSKLKNKMQDEMIFLGTTSGQVP